MLKNKLSSIGTVFVIAAHILVQPSMMAEDDTKLGRQVFADTMRLAHPNFNPDDHNGLLHDHTFLAGVKISIFEGGTFIKEGKVQEVGKWSYKDGYLELTIDDKLIQEFRVKDYGRNIVPIDRKVDGMKRVEIGFIRYQEAVRDRLAYRKEMERKALEKAAATLARLNVVKKEASVALAQAAAAKQKADAAHAQAAAEQKKAETAVNAAHAQLDVEKNKTSDALAQAAAEKKKADAALVQADASKEEAATALAQAAASKEEVATAYAQTADEKKRANDSYNRFADKLEELTREMNKDLPNRPADTGRLPAPVDPDVTKPASGPIGRQAPSPNRGPVPNILTPNPPRTFPRPIGLQAPSPNRGDDPGVRFGDDIIRYQDGKPTFTPVEKLKNGIPGSPNERFLQEQLLAKERQGTQETLRIQKNEADYQELATTMKKNNSDYLAKEEANRRRLKMLEQKDDIRRKEEAREKNNSHNPLSIPRTTPAISIPRPSIPNYNLSPPRTPLPYTPPSIPRAPRYTPPPSIPRAPNYNLSPPRPSYTSPSIPNYNRYNFNPLY